MQYNIDELNAVIVESLGINADDLDMNKSLIADLGADSLDLAELIVEIQGKYEIEISDEDAAEIKTVGDVHEKIKQYVDKK